MRQSSRRISCQRCGSSNRGGANFCKICGVSISELKDVLTVVGQNRVVTLLGDKITLRKKNRKLDKEFLVSDATSVTYQKARKLILGEFTFRGPNWTSPLIVRFDQNQQPQFEKLKEQINVLRDDAVVERQEQKVEEPSRQAPLN